MIEIGENRYKISHEYGVWQVLDTDDICVVESRSHDDARIACAAMETQIGGDVPQTLIVYLDFESGKYVAMEPSYVPDWHQICIGTIQEILNVAIT